MDSHPGQERLSRPMYTRQMAPLEISLSSLITFYINSQITHPRVGPGAVACK